MTPLQTNVAKALRARADESCKARGRHVDLAREIGGGTTANDVHTALVQLKADAYFIGRPYIDWRSFSVRLR